MKVTASLTPLLALAANVAARSVKAPRAVPTTTIAGIEVVDTQIVRDAQALIEEFETGLYAHQMRTWLIGAALINNNETLKAAVDPEVHAVATILHDLGWDMRPESPWISSDKRFEIDGALGAVKFVRENAAASEWDEERLRILFDGVALHGSRNIAMYKDIEVATIVESINMDFEGPHPPIPDEQINGIFEQFPAGTFGMVANTTFTWWAATKPNVTYDTFVQAWGDAYVEGYESVGHRVFDSFNGPAFNVHQGN